MDTVQNDVDSQFSQEQELARYRAEAVAAGIRFVWQDDPEPCIGCMCGSGDCPCASGAPHLIEGVTLWRGNTQLVASLWGICEASDDYRRYIEGELACEALQEIKAMEAPWLNRLPKAARQARAIQRKKER